LDDNIKKIAVFDFDGTMIKEDSIIYFFFRYFKFNFKNIFAFIKILVGAFKYFLKLESQISFKQKYIDTAMRYSKVKDVEMLSDDFSNYLLKKVSPDAVSWMKKLKNEGCELVLLSASVDIYLKKVSEKLGFDTLICTNVYRKGTRYKINKNCYGADKIEMLKEYYVGQKIDWENSYCFSDGPSDRKLMSIFGNSYIINNKRFSKKHPEFGFLKWH